MDVHRRPTMMNITVGVSSGGEQARSLETELRLSKTAILFGDKASLYSLDATFALANLALEGWTVEQTLEYCETILPALFTSKSELANAIDIAKDFIRLNKKRRRTAEEQSLWIRRRSTFDLLSRQLRETALETQKPVLAELLVAQKAGYLELKKFTSMRPDGMVNEFITTMRDTFATFESIPLVDDRTTDMCLKLLGTQELTETQRLQLAPVKLVDNVFDFFSAFERLPMADIIDIRRQFNDALVTFRGAMFSYARSMRELPWSPNFSEEAKVLYMEKVAPALQEVKELVEQDSPLRALLGNLKIEKGPLSMIGVGLGATYLTPFAAAAVVAGVAWQLVSNLIDHKQVQREMQGHELYYCYRIKERSDEPVS